jgi:aspartate kinase
MVGSRTKASWHTKKEKMRVFKFGGASVKDAAAVINVGRIIKSFEGEKLVVVISAMGKMTNKLEQLLEIWLEDGAYKETLSEIIDYHQDIWAGLSVSKEPPQSLRETFELLRQRLKGRPTGSYDFEYDQMVSFGEIISTVLVAEYLNQTGVASEWLDVRNVIKTDSSYRKAKVDWVRSKSAAHILEGYLNQDKVDVLVTQGFIGMSHLGTTTTLGREGSDFSAAILANLVDAEAMAIWKDAPGMMNADPKFFNNVKRLERLSYKEAAELSYFGASIIHPNTIKPLRNKHIPLYVRSFLDPSSPGTVIHEDASFDRTLPSYIFKANQALISISSREFSFMEENYLRDIFEFFASNKITINLMQNSALNFSVSIDDDERKLECIMDGLGPAFEVRYNRGVKLLTIRNKDDQTAQALMAGHEVLIEQRTRNTLRVVMRELQENSEQ